MKLSHDFKLSKTGVILRASPKLPGVRLEKLPSKKDRKIRSAWKRLAESSGKLPKLTGLL